MKVNIQDLIDFEKVNTLLEGFNKTTGFVTAILDLDGKVLSKSGWRNICTQFHRISPETCKSMELMDLMKRHTWMPSVRFPLFPRKK